MKKINPVPSGLPFVQIKFQKLKSVRNAHRTAERTRNESFKDVNI